MQHRHVVRRIAVAATQLGVGLLVASAPLVAQPADMPGVLRGVVVRREADVPLGYSIISLEREGRERFTDEDGRFILTGLALGAHRLRVRQIGYAPLDTTVIVARAGEHPPLRIELSRLVIQLARIKVVAPRACDGRRPPDPDAEPELAAIFDQLRQNAERYRLLADAYPFNYRMERRSGWRSRGGATGSSSVDTLLLQSDLRWQYSPGKVIVRTTSSDGSVELNVQLPSLADFADAAFQRHHCFEYAGLDSVDGMELTRVDFRASRKLRTPDVEGSVFLDPTTYRIRRATIRLTRTPPEARDVKRVSATTFYQEIAPSVIVIGRVEATNEMRASNKRDAIAELTESQRILDYSFLAERPTPTPRPP